MHKRILSTILVLVLICCIFTSCANEEDTVPYDSSFVEAFDFFVSYIESTRSGDWKHTVEEYLHFEDEENREMTIAYGTPTLSYEIIRIEKLSNKLWEIEYFITSEANRYGFYCANYVGIIDGRHRAMTNVMHIPAELSEGLEIEPYEPHGPGIVG